METEIRFEEDTDGEDEILAGKFHINGKEVHLTELLDCLTQPQIKKLIGRCKLELTFRDNEKFMEALKKSRNCHTKEVK
ncbi:MAG: hypothetical protein QXU18_08715 [Thermoplasmatales archaeon]